MLAACPRSSRLAQQQSPFKSNSYAACIRHDCTARGDKSSVLERTSDFATSLARPIIRLGVVLVLLIAVLDPRVCGVKLAPKLAAMRLV